MNFVRIDEYPYVFHLNGTFLRIWDGHTREIKPQKDKKGYMLVSLCKNGKVKQFYAHRLLALHFIPNPENKPEVDHINGIRDDNRLENLRWVTHKENMNGFKSNPAAIITKGGIYKRKNGWVWGYRMSGKLKSKYMKSKDALEKYRDETIKKYLN